MEELIWKRCWGITVVDANQLQAAMGRMLQRFPKAHCRGRFRLWSAQCPQPLQWPEAGRPAVCPGAHTSILAVGKSGHPAELKTAVLSATLEVRSSEIV